MADDHQDKIEQIREIRSRDIVQLGYNPYDIQQQQQQVGGVGAAGVNGVGGASAARGVQGIGDDNNSILGADFKSPWLRDRVTLSLEGQMALLEQRAAGRTNIVDLGYSNRNSFVSFSNGASVQIEPPGTYRLMYNRG